MEFYISIKNFSKIKTIKTKQIYINIYSKVIMIKGIDDYIRNFVDEWVTDVVISSYVDKNKKRKENLLNKIRDIVFSSVKEGIEEIIKKNEKGISGVFIYNHEIKETGKEPEKDEHYNIISRKIKKNIGALINDSDGFSRYIIFGLMDYMSSKPLDNH